MVKVILDTSVFIAAILSKNPETAPNKILNRWQEGDFMLVISPQLQEELVVILLRKGIKVLSWYTNFNTEFIFTSFIWYLKNHKDTKDTKFFIMQFMNTESVF